MGEDTEEQSTGQKLVGTQFNPSGLVSVGVIKDQFAEIIDDLHQTRHETTDVTKHWLLDQALGLCLQAQMMAVKAKTWDEQ